MQYHTLFIYMCGEYRMQEWQAHTAWTELVSFPVLRTRTRLLLLAHRRTFTGVFSSFFFFFSPANGKDEKANIITSSIFEAELQDVIPICHATIAGTRIIGRLIVGYALSFNKIEND